MTQEEIEGNKLVAFYIGASITDIPGIQKAIMYPINGGESKFVTRLRYHKSMDWLYPVYQNIRLFVNSKECSKLDSYSKMLLRTNFNIMKVTIAEGESIETLFNSIVKWIKIYNLKD